MSNFSSVGGSVHFSSRSTGNLWPETILLFRAADQRWKNRIVYFFGRLVLVHVGTNGFNSFSISLSKTGMANCPSLQKSVPIFLHAGFVALLAVPVKVASLPLEPSVAFHPAAAKLAVVLLMVPVEGALTVLSRSLTTKLAVVLLMVPAEGALAVLSRSLTTKLAALAVFSVVLTIGAAEFLEEHLGGLLSPHLDLALEVGRVSCEGRVKLMMLEVSSTEKLSSLASGHRQSKP